jgi:hypothetical protein
VTDNPDAEPVMPCEAAKTAIVVYGKQLGRKLTVCTDKHCSVHDPQAAAEAAANPAPTMAPGRRLRRKRKPPHVRPSSSSAEPSMRKSSDAGKSSAKSSSSRNRQNMRPSSYAAMNCARAAKRRSSA